MEIEISGHRILLIDGARSKGIGHLLLGKKGGDSVEILAVRWDEDAWPDADLIVAEFEDGMPGYTSGDGTKYSVKKDRNTGRTLWIECGFDD